MADIIRQSCLVVLWAGNPVRGRLSRRLFRVSRQPELAPRIVGYRSLPAAWQPHPQSDASHWQPPSGHPQEQAVQSQAPPQVVLAVSLVVFVWFVIVLSSFLERLMRFQRG